MTDKRSVEDRITEYLSLGGLFNPEMMDHQKVSNLLQDARTELSGLRAEMEHWRDRCITAMVTGEFPLSPHDDDPDVVSLRQAAEYAWHGTAYAEKAKTLHEVMKVLREVRADMTPANLSYGAPFLRQWIESWATKIDRILAKVKP
jgi:hypothetical protein